MKKTPTFFEIERRQRNLLILFFIILFIWVLVLFQYFRPGIFSFLFPKIEISYPEIKRVKLNLEPLENPKLKNLEPFPQFEPPKSEEIGKENPFSILSATPTSP